MLKFAHLISNALNPIIVPILTFGLLIAYKFHGELAWAWFVTGIFFCSITPIVYVAILHRLGKVNDYDISKRELRKNPLAVGIMSYLLGFALLRYLNAPMLMQGLLLCYAFNTFVVLIITLWWKISIHCLALTGPLAALWLVFGTPVLIVTAVLIPLMCWSRVTLKAHTPAQTVAGSALGFCFTAVELLLIFKMPLP
jgi:membrane-associated phospholipid phosphatase